MSKDKQHVTQPAWDLFCQGDLAGAERAAMLAVKQMNNTNISPIPDIMILKAFYLSRLQRFEDARRLFGRVLEDRPDDAYAQEGYLLALRDELTLNKSTHKNEVRHTAGNRRKQNGNLLLGLGTGRSGSTTLVKLWKNQKACYASHEHPPRLPWAGGASRLEFHKRRLDLLLESFNFVADAAHWWLPHIDYIMDNYKDVRVIIMKRERKTTVSSFLKIKGGGYKGSINHWMKHDGTYWAKNIWDECYPSYDARDMEKAIGMYWDNYYATVERIMQRFPSSVRIFETERLGEPGAQTEILSFCGFAVPRLKTDLHLNRGDATDGHRMY